MRDAARLQRAWFAVLAGRAKTHGSQRTNQPSKPLQLAASLSSAAAVGLWPISENFADGGDTVESSLNFGNLGIMEPDEN
jgi:hypothetical protein